MPGLSNRIGRGTWLAREIAANIAPQSWERGIFHQGVGDAIELDQGPIERR